MGSWKIAVFILCLLVPIPVSAAIVPLGESIEIEIPLEEMIVVEDLSLCKTAIKQQDKVYSLQSKKELIELISKSSSTSIPLTMSRDGEQYTLACSAKELERLLPVVIDTVAGVGTLTFLDTTSNTYYALGHPIQEHLTGTIPTGANGHIRLAAVDKIVRSAPQKPGFKVTKPLIPLRVAPVTQNSLYGLLGDASSVAAWFPSRQEIQVSNPRKGKATLRTVTAGDQVEEYDLEITAIDSDKFFVTITDEQLLNLSGGILQGMSGSPIIQNNHLVGALTHMNSVQPTKGAAISIDQMKK
ncbi:SpoIVB peptidase S55 domain-containing protein [Chryseomicrobium sp. FSL W7-1435]|uniref:SpoIVB peptidase S55 domain-containing protein n=1 Tax=Chryseomicrobium sp. FSL W7-1435 TaxID=2921704 RepID=UPI00315ACB04